MPQTKIHVSAVLPLIIHSKFLSRIFFCFDFVTVELLEIEIEKIFEAVTFYEVLNFFVIAASRF